MFRIASSARSALPSCTAPSTALITTTPKITEVSTQCPSAVVTAAAARRT
jgi:hypothetical protein